jgi:hypothetical protein
MLFYSGKLFSNNTNQIGRIFLRLTESSQSRLSRVSPVSGKTPTSTLGALDS